MFNTAERQAVGGGRANRTTGTGQLRKFAIRRVAAAALFTAVAGAAPRVFAQVDAAAAYVQGKEAYQNGQFAKARDAFLRASQTDPRNAEIFVWLGKAQYELGAVDEAIAAWKTTASLAPEEPTAAAMLKALTGRSQGAETGIKLVAALLGSEFFERAADVSNTLLSDKSLSDAQRSRAMLLRARALLEMNRVPESAGLVEEALLKYPALVDPTEADLLLARAQLRAGGSRLADGVATLRKLVADHPDTPAGISARYELLAFDIDQQVDPAKADALAKWVTAHPEQSQAERARRKVVTTYLALTAIAGDPAAGGPLAPTDKIAISFAATLYGRLASATEAYKLTEQLVGHLDGYYASHKAFAAATAGIDALLAVKNLPATSRLMALRASARYRGELVIKQLTDAAARGAAATPELPKALTDAMAALDTITGEFPAAAAWRDRAALAERVRAIGVTVPWPAKISQLKPEYAWAVEIALSVAASGVDPVAVESATKSVTTIVTETTALEQAPAKTLALSLNTRLLRAVPTDSSVWVSVAGGQVALLDAAATAEFRENIRTGRPEQNTKLSGVQTDLVDLLGKLVSRDVNAAGSWVSKLHAHLRTWIEGGQPNVAEAAYVRLTDALPAAQRRQTRLTVVQLWIEQAMVAHRRLTAAGLDDAHSLDPLLAKATKRLYELQAELVETDPFLAGARATLDGIVNHYNALGYFDVAEQVVRIKADAASPAADAYAQFQLARLQDEAGGRELASLLKQYKASENLTLTPAGKRALTAYQQFITDHPTDPLAAQAARGLLTLAQRYEDYGAHDVAATVYGDVAAFASKTITLSFAAPGQVSFAERAAFAVAGAADVKARQAFAKALSVTKDKPVPPEKVSAEFTAALKIYREFLAERPQSTLVGAALQRINAIALDYARADAWDVAEGIYASLLQGKLKVRDPARVEFCRGMCRVGKVMPEHAKEVLGALLSLRGPESGRGTDGDVAKLINEQKLLIALDNEVEDRAAGKDRLSAGRRGAQTSSGIMGVDGTLDLNGGSAGFGGGGGAGAAVPATPATPAAQPGWKKDTQVGVSDALGRADGEALAAISRQEARRAQQVAALRDTKGLETRSRATASSPQGEEFKAMAEKPASQPQEGAALLPVLSEAELARQQAALDEAYQIFRAIKTMSPQTAAAEQARGEIMVSIDYWRGINQPQRAITLAEKYLHDNASDAQLPQLRMAIALDHLSWASQPLDKLTTSQEMLSEVGQRFETARVALASMVTEFRDEKPLVQQAQWQTATSFLTQARVVDGFSPVLARGQYVRAATELQRVADRYADHPQMAQVPQILWEIARELSQRQYFEEAINVWNDLSINHSTHPLAGQAKTLIAQTYQGSLGRPLRAAEIYLEINFARGGGDVAMQNAVFGIGSQLTQQKRWVEALHVLQVYVDSFPRHQNAGQALAMIGQIHQSNESWKDAIAAYQRVIEEYPGAGQSLQEAKWAIAECVINLSQWKQAVEAYQGFVAAFPKDGRVGEANRRIGILKDLGNFQMLVDENGPKAFDAQFQMASIIEKQLTLQPKAIVEYQKVATNYRKSHLADDALYAVGLIDRERGEIDMARAAWRETAAKYPDSPLADDALYQIGKSYEDEAQQLAGLTQEAVTLGNSTVAQNRAYRWANENAQAQRANQAQKLNKAKSAGKEEGELQLGSNANFNGAFDTANTYAAVEKVQQEVQALTAAQLADRQDKINGALRKAVVAYDEAAKVPGADRAGESLLRMAVIYNDRLGDGQAAMRTWLEIVRQFSGTAVAEEASWQIAAQYERAGQYAEAVESYKAFLRNYRRSPKASEAQFFIAENYEHLNQWVSAMDQYSNYLNNFPEGPLAQKAREQISFIKTYRL